MSVFSWCFCIHLHLQPPIVILVSSCFLSLFFCPFSLSFPFHVSLVYLPHVPAHFSVSGARPTRDQYHISGGHVLLISHTISTFLIISCTLPAAVQSNTNVCQPVYCYSYRDIPLLTNMMHKVNTTCSRKDSLLYDGIITAPRADVCLLVSHTIITHQYI